MTATLLRGFSLTEAPVAMLQEEIDSRKMGLSGDRELKNKQSFSLVI